MLFIIFININGKVNTFLYKSLDVFPLKHFSTIHYKSWLLLLYNVIEREREILYLINSWEIKFLINLVGCVIVLFPHKLKV